MDDVPEAKDDTNFAEEGNTTPATGNVITGSHTASDLNGSGVPSTAADVLGDTPGTVTQFVHGVNTYDPTTAVGGQVVSNDGTTIVITTDLGGTFTFNFSTGAYSYLAPALDTISSDQSETFLYTLKDSDGDTDTATLTINVDDVPQAKDDFDAVDEGLLMTDGNVITGEDADDPGATGTPPIDSSEADIAGDGFALIRQITHDGVTYTVDTSGADPVVTATSGTKGTDWDFVFNTTDGLVLTIKNTSLEAPAEELGAEFSIVLIAGTGTETGDYSYTSPQLGTLSGADANEIFTYVIEDGDGDTDPADLTITVNDIQELFPSGLAYTVLGRSTSEGGGPATAFLYGIDLESGGFEQIGEILIDGAGGNYTISGLTLDPETGFIYGFGGQGSTRVLLRIDPTTAETEVLGSDPDFGGTGGLSFELDGTLWFATGNEISQIDLDPTSGTFGQILTATTITITNVSSNAIDSFAIDPNNPTTAYFSVGTKLYRVDISTSGNVEATLLTDVLVPGLTSASIEALSFDDFGTLFAADDGGRIIRVTLTSTTAVGEVVTTIANNEVTSSGLKSLAISIVEPGTYIHLIDTDVREYTAFIDKLVTTSGTLSIGNEPFPHFPDLDPNTPNDDYLFTDTVTVNQVVSSEAVLTVTHTTGSDIDSIFVQNDDNLDVTIIGFEDVRVRLGSSSDDLQLNMVTVDGANSGQITTGVVNQFGVIYELTASDDEVDILPRDLASGAFTIRTGAGDDTITIDGDNDIDHLLAGTFTIDGGSGDNDIVKLVNLSGAIDLNLRGVEMLDLTDIGQQMISLDAADILDADRIILFDELGLASNASASDIQARVQTLFGEHTMEIDGDEDGTNPDDTLTLTGFGAATDTDVQLTNGEDADLYSKTSSQQITVQQANGDVSFVSINVTVNLYVDDDIAVTSS